MVLLGLIFVLKLDESDLIKGQKLERVSLTLMNRALDASISNADERHFSVQSENEIWWLAADEVLSIFLKSILCCYPLHVVDN